MINPIEYRACIHKAHYPWKIEVKLIQELF